MERSRLIPMLFILAASYGCAQLHSPTPGGRLITEATSSKDAALRSTPYRATYVLKHWPTPPTDPPPREWIPERQCTDVFVRGLGKWQSIGFEKSPEGDLLAVAGDEKIKLEPGRYTWHIHPDTEYTGVQWLVQETGERTAQIIALPFGLAIAVVLVPLALGVILLTFPLMLLG